MPARRYPSPVAGGIVFVLAMVVVVPVGVMVTGAVWSAVFGWLSSEERAAAADAAESVA